MHRTLRISSSLNPSQVDLALRLLQNSLFLHETAEVRESAT
jgi:hypothetical protein